MLGNKFERKPSDSSDDIIFALFVVTKSWPFFLHTISGRGIPSAVQLNFTLCPLAFVTDPPVSFNNAALTKISK